MFDNIGGKIKTLAKVLCWIGIAFSVITGIAVMFGSVSSVSYNGSRYATGGSSVVAGILIIVLGCLFSWLGSFFAYGFGQLIENSDELVRLKKSEKE